MKVPQWVGQGSWQALSENMTANAWRTTLARPAFLRAELLLVVISGTALSLFPQYGNWAIAAALIPTGFRFVVGARLIQRTHLDPLIAIFLAASAVAYWAAYDHYSSTHKFLAILAGVILYYVLSSQPRENRVWVSSIFFAGGVAASLYFLLTYDFVSAPRKLEVVNQIGRLIVWLRPELGWKIIHPNYVAGGAAIASLFGFYVLIQRRGQTGSPSSTTRGIVWGLLLLLFTILMATSRGALMAVASGVSLWLLWIGMRLASSRYRFVKVSVFPTVVLTFLAAVVIFLYLGPAKSGNQFSASYFFGDGSRLELIERSLYLVTDFPIFGAGLGSFPGLYSHYILGIPNYNVPNSHNLFLDVCIELGIVGGASFLSMYLLTIWRTSRYSMTALIPGDRLFNGVLMGALVIAFVHGMVDNYLFQGIGAVLALALLGLVPAQTNFTTVAKDTFGFVLTRMLLLVVLSAGLLVLLLSYKGTIQSIWYSNLGAVQMAKIELEGFPTNQWASKDTVVLLQDAEASFLAALRADPSNRTANHRLGLIAVLRRDFPAAIVFLEMAHLQAPGHRGIMKSLGYSYVWTGALDEAQPLLAGIPESIDELDSYAWYWASQNLPELSSYAMAMKNKIYSMPVHP